MAWTITERFPSWGETGEFPANGFFYEGGDQVNEKHLDALWNGVDGLEEDVQAALNDIDSDADGIVDEADTLTAGGTALGDMTVQGNIDAQGNLELADSGSDNSFNIRFFSTNNDTYSVDYIDGRMRFFTESDGTRTFELFDDNRVSFGSDILAKDGEVIWDESNGWVPQAQVEQGAGSGLDADLLDGQQYSDLQSEFVTASGDTMTGSLDMGNSVIDNANELRLNDQDSDGIDWRISESPTTGRFRIYAGNGGGNMLDLEHNGDLRIEGSLTEGASL